MENHLCDMVNEEKNAHCNLYLRKAFKKYDKWLVHVQKSTTVWFCVCECVIYLYSCTAIYGVAFSINKNIIFALYMECIKFTDSDYSF